MVRPFPLLAAAAILALTGVVHGLRTDRWNVSSELHNATERLSEIPLRVGEWEARPGEVDGNQLRVAQAAGYRSLSYVNRFTKEQVQILILCGRPGAMAQHTPEMCYQGAGYRLKSAPQPCSVLASDNNQEFWTAPFVKPGPIPGVIRIFWAWSAGGDWVAANNPRFSFLRQPALYKLYAIAPMSTENQTADENVAPKLLRILLPELRRCLSPAD